MKNAEIARQFIEANPTIVNNRTIAKLLVERYPDRFANIETARDSVRYVMGKDRKSTRLNSSHSQQSRMPSSA